MYVYVQNTSRTRIFFNCRWIGTLIKKWRNYSIKCNWQKKLFSFVSIWSDCEIDAGAALQNADAMADAVDVDDSVVDNVEDVVVVAELLLQVYSLGISG